MNPMKIFFNGNRDKMVSESINQSKTNYKEMKIPVEKWIRRKRKLPGEMKMMNVQKVKRNLYESHDRLVNKLEAQFDSCFI